MCTDKRNRSKYSNYVSVDYRNCGLLKDTIVIADKVILIHPSDIDSVYGSVSVNELDDITETLLSTDGISNIKENLEDILYD